MYVQRTDEVLSYMCAVYMGPIMSRTNASDPMGNWQTSSLPQVMPGGMAKPFPGPTADVGNVCENWQAQLPPAVCLQPKAALLQTPLTGTG